MRCALRIGIQLQEWVFTSIYMFKVSLTRSAIVLGRLTRVLLGIPLSLTLEGVFNSGTRDRGRDRAGGDP